MNAEPKSLLWTGEMKNERIHPYPHLGKAIGDNRKGNSCFNEGNEKHIPFPFPGVGLKRSKILATPHSRVFSRIQCCISACNKCLCPPCFRLRPPLSNFAAGKRLQMASFAPAGLAGHPLPRPKKRMGRRQKKTKKK